VISILLKTDAKYKEVTKLNAVTSEINAVTFKGVFIFIS
jgi:hypothetical protein